MKIFAFFLLLFFTSATQAQMQTSFSLGLGTSYGGLGAKLRTEAFEGYYLFGGAGLMYYSSLGGAAYGWQTGIEKSFANDRHGLSASYGALSARTISETNLIYYGPSLNYAYYFSGFGRSTWLIGGSAYRGELEDNDYGFEATTTGVAFLVGYQF